jgi:lysophospholipase L1-like esterase
MHGLSKGLMNMRTRTPVLAFTACLACAAYAGEPPAHLKDIKRIVFLGDSITQNGEYVTDIECWFTSHNINVEVLNLGLSSETATDLTQAENAGHLKAHKFGRPFISERLERVLSAAKPDMVIACYGMNDGSALPSDESGLKRFAEAITRLRDTALRLGAGKVLICTPPVHDSKDPEKRGAHDEALSRFSEWIMARKADGWDVVDIHYPMRKELDERRKKNPAFAFAGDGVHPNREGHWVMAREILIQFFGAKLDGKTSAEQLFPAKGDELRKLLASRRSILSAAWLSKTRHQRPGVPGGPGKAKGPSIEDAKKKAAEISAKISETMKHE